MSLRGVSWLASHDFLCGTPIADGVSLVSDQGIAMRLNATTSCYIRSIRFQILSALRFEVRRCQRSVRGDGGELCQTLRWREYASVGLWSCDIFVQRKEARHSEYMAEFREGQSAGMAPNSAWHLGKVTTLLHRPGSSSASHSAAYYAGQREWMLCKARRRVPAYRREPTHECCLGMRLYAPALVDRLGRRRTTDWARR
jgi:hypothetical protein